MARFRSKPVEIEAEQYQPGKQIDGVKERPAELIFSRNGDLYYLSAAFPNMSRVDAWIPVDANDPEGKVYPFAFYEVKAGLRKPASADDPLTKRYLEYVKETELPAPYAYVVTTHGQDTRVVAGDWIVKEPDGKGHYPVKPEIFESRWEQVESSTTGKSPLWPDCWEWVKVNTTGSG